jgi:hypothetical protein
VIAVGAGIVVVLAIAYCCCCRRREGDGKDDDDSEPVKFVRSILYFLLFRNPYFRI